MRQITILAMAPVPAPCNALLDHDRPLVYSYNFVFLFISSHYMSYQFRKEL